MFIPERGDVVWLSFEPQKGKEIQKTRPAAAIRNMTQNFKATAKNIDLLGVILYF